MDMSVMESLLNSAAGVAGGVFAVVCILLVAACVAIIVGNWKIFKKMGMPGWYSIIPYFSDYAQTRGVYGIGWWFLIGMASTIAGWIGISGFLLTVINIVVLIYTVKYNIDLALCFGKHWAFGLLLAFVPFVAILMLGFGKDVYKGPRLSGPLNLSLN